MAARERDRLPGLQPVGGRTPDRWHAADVGFGEDDWRSGAGRFADWREQESDWPFDPGPLAEALAAVDRMRPLAEQQGTTVAQLALGWVLGQAGVTAVIAGSRDPGHTRENAAAGSAPLDDVALSQLDLLFASGPA